MSTFVQMRTVIADDLDRSDLTTQINRAINRAILHYEKEPFWFKETVTTFATVDGTKKYGTAQGIPSDIAEIDYLEIAITSNDERKITRRSYAYLENIDASHFEGQPTDWAWYDDAIYLYPIPDGVYTINISYKKTYTTLSADADTNDWTTEAEDLIEARALWTLYARTLKNDEEANKYKGIELEALEALRSKSELLQSKDSVINPTAF